MVIVHIWAPVDKVRYLKQAIKFNKRKTMGYGYDYGYGCGIYEGLSHFFSLNMFQPLSFRYNHIQRKIPQ